MPPPPPLSSPTHPILADAAAAAAAVYLQAAIVLWSLSWVGSLVGCVQQQTLPRAQQRLYAVLCASLPAACAVHGSASPVSLVLHDCPSSPCRSCHSLWWFALLSYVAAFTLPALLVVFKEDLRAFSTSLAAATIVRTHRALHAFQAML